MKIKERKNIDNLMTEIGEILAEYLYFRLKLILNTIWFEGIEEDPMERIFGELILECKDKVFSDNDFLSGIGTFEFIHELDVKIEEIIKNKMGELSNGNV